MFLNDSGNDVCTPGESEKRANTQEKTSRVRMKPPGPSYQYSVPASALQTSPASSTERGGLMQTGRGHLLCCQVGGRGVRWRSNDGTGAQQEMDGSRVDLLNKSCRGLGINYERGTTTTIRDRWFYLRAVVSYIYLQISMLSNPSRRGGLTWRQRRGRLTWRAGV